MALSDNLIYYMPLDEASGDALDAHGSNDMTESGGTIATTTGKIGDCRDLEADDTEWFQIADNADISVGNIDASWFMWLNPESFSSFNTWLAKDQVTREYGAFVDTSDSNKPSFYASHDGTSVTTVKFGAGLSTATWAFVAFGHSATADEIWISVNAGTPVTAAFNAAGVFDGTNPLTIGMKGDSTLFYDGLIDEVAFFKRDIRSDLSAFYNSGNGRSYSDIIAGVGGGGATPHFFEVGDAMLMRF